jgi:hypothetical protein
MAELVDDIQHSESLAIDGCEAFLRPNMDKAALSRDDRLMALLG